MKTYSISNILVLIFWIFLIFLFLNELLVKPNETFKNTDKIIVYNFNTTWCGHSRSFQPIWDAFVKSLEKSNNIQAIDVKCDNDMNSKLLKKYNVEGFPTVVIVKGDNHEHYSGERSINGLRKVLGLNSINNNYNNITCNQQNNNIKKKVTCDQQNNKDITCDHTLNNSHQNNNHKTKIYNFNTSWCGYSLKFQPIWNQFYEQVNNPDIEIIDVKCDIQENQNFCKKYEIPGYPSILKETSSGEIIHYKGPRTVESLVNFTKN